MPMKRSLTLPLHVAYIHLLHTISILVCCKHFLWCLEDKHALLHVDHTMRLALLSAPRAFCESSPFSTKKESRQKKTNGTCALSVDRAMGRKQGDRGRTLPGQFDVYLLAQTWNPQAPHPDHTARGLSNFLHSSAVITRLSAPW